MKKSQAPSKSSLSSNVVVAGTKSSSVSTSAMELAQSPNEDTRKSPRIVALTNSQQKQDDDDPERYLRYFNDPEEDDPLFILKDPNDPKQKGIFFSFNVYLETI